MRKPIADVRPAKKPKLFPNLYKTKLIKTNNAKRNQLIKEKFEEDRAKLNRLRNQRKFQPGW